MAENSQLTAIVTTFTNQILTLQEQIDALSDRLAALEGPKAKNVTSQEPERVSGESEFKIVSVDARVTETNDSWSKFAWKLVLRNDSSASATINASVEFLDSDGFIVADDQAYDLRVPLGAEKTFTGYALIDAEIVGNVASVSAKAGLADV